ncbi:Conidiation-specific protein 6 [Penicillium sp. IBT 35674x]|nr:Conidiation-specific protein 6 [Penicillium sp. IBT 35674x]
MRGYKASATETHVKTDSLCSTLSNSKVSNEAKQHAQYMLNNELGGDEPRKEIHSAQENQSGGSTRVAAGYKAAQSNPNVTHEGKQRAGEKLEEMDEAPEE